MSGGHAAPRSWPGPRPAPARPSPDSQALCQPAQGQAWLWGLLLRPAGWGWAWAGHGEHREQRSARGGGPGSRRGDGHQLRLRDGPRGGRWPCAWPGCQAEGTPGGRASSLPCSPTALPGAGPRQPGPRLRRVSARGWGNATHVWPLSLRPQFPFSQRALCCPVWLGLSGGCAGPAPPRAPPLRPSDQKAGWRAAHVGTPAGPGPGRAVTPPHTKPELPLLLF